MRNHGLKGRNKNSLFGYNSRLDTIQACVANHLLKKIKHITNMRIKNSLKIEKGLKEINGLILKSRKANLREVFHLYEFRTKNVRLRNKLVNYLIKNNIDAKIHYPVPMHLQPAARKYKYKKGDFPNAEKIANSTISLPVHEFINDLQISHIIKSIKKFFNES